MKQDTLVGQQNNLTATTAALSSVEVGGTDIRALYLQALEHTQNNISLAPLTTAVEFPSSQNITTLSPDQDMPHNEIQSQDMPQRMTADMDVFPDKVAANNNTTAPIVASSQTTLANSDITRFIQQFNQWKAQASVLVARYVAWKQAKTPNKQALAELEHLLNLLKVERLRIAVVGEFSRGKSEFINALLAQDSHVRLFPARVGRTTMCPVELYSDVSIEPYLKLLPIQTRESQNSLSYFRKMPESWHHQNLDIRDSEGLKRILREVARTIEVSNEEAIALGFQVEFLEASMGREGCVHIPAWRHALINFPHPLLDAGVSIIDTPGINAPGLEADLTHNILPDAQGLLFLLSVETGVTASDYAMWHKTIAPLARQHYIALLSVLNKIDLLEHDDEPIGDSIERIVRMSSKQLKIATKQVIPLSSKYALKAAIEQDSQGINRSGFFKLEDRLVLQVIETRQYLLKKRALKTFLHMVQHDISLLRKQVLTEEAGELIKHHKIDMLQQELNKKNELFEAELIQQTITITKTEAFIEEFSALIKQASQPLSQTRYHALRGHCLTQLVAIKNKPVLSEGRDFVAYAHQIMCDFINSLVQDLQTVKMGLAQYSHIDVPEPLEHLDVTSTLLPINDLAETVLMLQTLELPRANEDASVLENEQNVLDFLPKIDFIYERSLAMVDASLVRVQTQCTRIIAHAQKTLSSQQQRILELKRLLGETDHNEDQVLLSRIATEITQLIEG